jgi:hypothetical protein
MRLARRSMIRYAALRALLLALLLARDNAAAAQEPAAACAWPNGMATGPVQAGLLDGELGRAYRACPRSELALGGAGLAVIEPDQFYGRLQAAGVLRASWARTEESELYLRLEAVRFDTVISSVDAAAFGLGHTTLGAAQRLLEGPRARLALGTRVVLSTAFALYHHAWPIGVDVLALGEYSAREWLRLHGGAGPLGSFALGGGPTQPRLGVALLAGAQWLPWGWASVVLDLHAQLGYTSALDVLALAPGLRFGGTRVGVELSGLVPVLGRERALAAVLLQVGVRP